MTLPAPFVRDLRRGMTGDDVIAVKRAAAKAGVRPPAMANTATFGATLEAEIEKFQRAHHLTPDGDYGAATHKAMIPFFDQYGRHLLAVEKAKLQPHPPTGLRHLVVATALYGYAHRDQIHYSQGPQRMMGVTEHLRPPEFPSEADCSSYATWCYYVAGAPDPNGLGYNGQGYTGTLAAHGHAVTGNGQPADLVFYGRGAPWEHVAISLGDGTVISHGSEPGPLHLPIDYRSDRGQVRSYL